MADANGEGVVVAQVGDIEDGEAIKVDAAVTGTVDDIAVFHDGDEYYALDDTCSHEKASLSEGWIEDGVVECPLHAGKFCLKDGTVQSMPATEDVVAHQLIVEGDDLVLIPAPGSLAG